MNHITIEGRLETDPVRKEANGSVVCCFRLASGRTGKKGGRLWIDICAKELGWKDGGRPLGAIAKSSFLPELLDSPREGL